MSFDDLPLAATLILAAFPVVFAARAMRSHDDLSGRGVWRHLRSAAAIRGGVLGAATFLLLYDHAGWIASIPLGWVAGASVSLVTAIRREAESDPTSLARVDGIAIWQLHGREARLNRALGVSAEDPSERWEIPPEYAAAGRDLVRSVERTFGSWGLSVYVAAIGGGTTDDRRTVVANVSRGNESRVAVWTDARLARGEFFVLPRATNKRYSLGVSRVRSELPLAPEGYDVLTSPELSSTEVVAVLERAGFASIDTSERDVEVRVSNDGVAVLWERSDAADARLPELLALASRLARAVEAVRADESDLAGRAVARYDGFGRGDRGFGQ